MVPARLSAEIRIEVVILRAGTRRTVLKVDLCNAKPPTNALALYDDVNGHSKHLVNVTPVETTSAIRLLYQQRQLLEGKAR